MIFTATGYIEVRHNGTVLSRHRVEREAIESVSSRPPGRYEIHFPVVRVDIEGIEHGEINGAVTL